MISNRWKQMKQYQARMRGPSKSTGSHSASAGPATQQFQEQPYENICVDPVLEQAKQEEAFYAEQLSSGYQVVSSGIVESAADFINKHVYEEAVRQELASITLDEEHFSQQQGYPVQPSTSQQPHEPFMHAPGTIPGLGLGGY